MIAGQLRAAGLGLKRMFGRRRGEVGKPHLTAERRVGFVGDLNIKAARLADNALLRALLENA
jgi:hypothetical protein